MDCWRWQRCLPLLTANKSELLACILIGSFQKVRSKCLLLLGVMQCHPFSPSTPPEPPTRNPKSAIESAVRPTLCSMFAMCHLIICTCIVNWGNHLYSCSALSFVYEHSVSFIFNALNLSFAVYNSVYPYNIYIYIIYMVDI